MFLLYQKSLVERVLHQEKKENRLGFDTLTISSNTIKVSLLKDFIMIYPLHPLISTDIV